ncbi:MAG: ferrous iron transport protein A [Clostridia bacterium]|nr:ferrous iron transport protein A [Clostridia bacterium]
MRLNNGKKGNEYMVTLIPDEMTVKQKLLSLGIYEGAKITIKQFLPGKGPLIIIAGTGEVAISHEVAHLIEVE